MKRENDAKLVESFPKIFAPIVYDYGTVDPLSRTQHGDGWFEIVFELCTRIQQYLDANPSVPQVVVTQIKEKFGSLRFSFNGGDEAIHRYVDVAMRQADVTCELCGSLGERRPTAWIRTLCEEHYNEAKQNQRPAH